MRVAPSGTCTGQRTSAAAPAASCTVCTAGCAEAGEKSTAPSALPLSVAFTAIARAVVLRSVKPASKRSPARASGDRPLSICKSCVTRTLVLPVPKRSVPASATATSRKLVSESFNGTSMTAWPCASRVTVPRHSSSVSNSSRVGLRPPPPPGGKALRP